MDLLAILVIIIILIILFTMGFNILISTVNERWNREVSRVYGGAPHLNPMYYIAKAATKIGTKLFKKSVTGFIKLFEKMTKINLSGKLNTLITKGRTALEINMLFMCGLRSIIQHTQHTTMLNSRYRGGAETRPIPNGILEFQREQQAEIAFQKQQQEQAAAEALPDDDKPEETEKAVEKLKAADPSIAEKVGDLEAAATIATAKDDTEPYDESKPDDLVVDDTEVDKTEALANNAKREEIRNRIIQSYEYSQTAITDEQLDTMINDEIQKEEEVEKSRFDILLSSPTTYAEMVSWFNNCNFDATKDPVEPVGDSGLGWSQIEYIDKKFFYEIKGTIIDKAKTYQNFKLDFGIVDIISNIVIEKLTSGMNPMSLVRAFIGVTTSGAIGIETIKNLLRISPTDAAFPLYIVKQIIYILVDYIYEVKRPLAIAICASLNETECMALDSLLAIKVDNEFDTINCNGVEAQVPRHKTTIRISVFIKQILPLFAANLPKDLVKDVVELVLSGGASSAKTAAKKAVKEAKEQIEEEVKETVNKVKSDPFNAMSIITDKIKEKGISLELIGIMGKLFKLMFTRVYIDKSRLSHVVECNGHLMLYNLNTGYYEPY